MIVLLIGPSGVVKTFLGKRIAHEKGYEFEELDEYKRAGIDSIDLKLEIRIEEYLDSLILQDKLFIIDVGAGFQERFSLEFFKKYKDYLVYIYPERIEDLKNKIEGRSMEGLKCIEYSKNRKDVYCLAKYQVKRESNFQNKDCAEDLNKLNDFFKLK